MQSGTEEIEPYLVIRRQKGVLEEHRREIKRPGNMLRRNCIRQDTQRAIKGLANYWQLS